MFVSFWMVQKLTREINNLQYDLMQATNRLSNHQKYASRLGGNGIMGLNNIAGLNSEILPRATLFAQYSNQASSMSALQNLQAMKAMGLIQNTGNPMMQMQLEHSAFMRFKEEALKALKQQEVAQMNEVEKQIQLEVSSIQQRLNIKEKQLQAYKEQASKEAENAAPKFA